MSTSTCNKDTDSTTCTLHSQLSDKLFPVELLTDNLINSLVLSLLISFLEKRWIYGEVDCSEKLCL